MPNDRQTGWFERRSLTEPEDRGSVPMLRRIGHRLRAMFAILREGFEEHAWSGKLFMLATAGSAAFTTVGIGVALLLGVGLGMGGASVAAFTMFALFGAPMAFFQWKLLEGVARFRPWARIAAMVVSGFGVLSGLGALGWGFGIRGVVIAAAEVGLSAQFFVYFLRNRDLFHAARTEAPIPALMPETPPPPAIPAGTPDDDRLRTEKTAE
jgi:hypothetical protein